MEWFILQQFIEKYILNTKGGADRYHIRGGFAFSYNDILDYSYYRDKNWREYLIIGTANGGIEIRAFPEMKLIKKEDIFTKDEDKIFKLFVINEKTIIVLTENFKLYRIFPN